MFGWIVAASVGLWHCAGAAFFRGRPAVEPLAFRLNKGHLTISGSSTLGDWKAQTRRVMVYLLARVDSQAIVVRQVRVQVPIYSLQSQLPDMDERMHALLGGAQYRYIWFVAEIPDSLPLVITDSLQQYRLEGVLHVRGVSRRIRVPIRVRLEGHRLYVKGHTQLSMVDFGIEPPAFLDYYQTFPSVRVFIDMLLEPMMREEEPRD